MPDRQFWFDGQWIEFSVKYPQLSAVMLRVLCIPHSNAESERVFSAVGRMGTKFRPNLGCSVQ